MGLFKNNYEKILDDCIKKLEMNMSNNYKDAAQDNFREFEENLAKFTTSGKVKGKSLQKYEEKQKELAGKLEGYTHKDQKPYWT